MPLAVGLVARTLPLFSPLPFGDGGLFYTMASEMRREGWPLFTGYNHASIPFAYPPLGLAILAVIPGDILDLMRIVPPILSAAIVFSVYLLGREMLSARGAAFAAATYAVMPAGWALYGGDAVRSTGVLLALLATLVALRLPSGRGALLAGLLMGAAVLSHPSTVAYAAFTVALAALRWPASIRRLLVMASVTLAVALPWFVVVGTRYGLDSIWSAATSHVTSFPPARLATFGPTGLGALDPLVGLALIGAFWRPWLALWTLVLVFMPATSDRYVVVGLGLLCGAALENLPQRFAGVPAAAAVLSFVALVGTQPALTPDLVSRMQAAVSRAPLGTEFAVKSQSGSIIEWFPAITGARSLGTSQGLEWVGRDAFWDAVERNSAIQRGQPVGGQPLDLTSP